MDNEFKSMPELIEENKRLQKTVDALHFDIKLNLGMIERQEEIVQKLISFHDQVSYATSIQVSRKFVEKKLKEILGDKK